MNRKTIQKGLLILIMALTITGTTFADNGNSNETTSIKTNTPNIDNLIYTFETEGTDEATTTDYIASLPDADPGLVLGQITYYALVIANILAFIAFLVAGIFMIISQGNDEQLGKAKSILMYTIIAMAVCATALAIVTGVTQLDFFNPYI
ncbi:hypothetical protein GF369_04445 [Candidatus Peregrinibacteria bacterium]|nr:hypothetical protein [Candidatus Peregrinibacteria bacterium]